MGSFQASCGICMTRERACVFAGDGCRWAICCDREAAPIVVLAAFGGERAWFQLGCGLVARTSCELAFIGVEAPELAVCCPESLLGLVHERFSHVLCCDRDAARALYFRGKVHCCGRGAVVCIESA